MSATPPPPAAPADSAPKALRPLDELPIEVDTAKLPAGGEITVSVELETEPFPRDWIRSKLPPDTSAEPDPKKKGQFGEYNLTTYTESPDRGKKTRVFGPGKARTVPAAPRVAAPSATADQKATTKLAVRLVSDPLYEKGMRLTNPQRAEDQAPVWEVTPEAKTAIETVGKTCFRQGKELLKVGLFMWFSDHLGDHGNDEKGNLIVGHAEDIGAKCAMSDRGYLRFFLKPFAKDGPKKRGDGVDFEVKAIGRDEAGWAYYEALAPWFGYLHDLGMAANGTFVREVNAYKAGDPAKFAAVDRVVRGRHGINTTYQLMELRKQQLALGEGCQISPAILEKLALITILHSKSQYPYIGLDEYVNAHVRIEQNYRWAPGYELAKLKEKESWGNTPPNELARWGEWYGVKSTYKIDVTVPVPQGEPDDTASKELSVRATTDELRYLSAIGRCLSLADALRNRGDEFRDGCGTRILCLPLDLEELEIQAGMRATPPGPLFYASGSFKERSPSTKEAFPGTRCTFLELFQAVWKQRFEAWRPSPPDPAFPDGYGAAVQAATRWPKTPDDFTKPRDTGAVPLGALKAMFGPKLDGRPDGSNDWPTNYARYPGLQDGPAGNDVIAPPYEWGFLNGEVGVRQIDMIGTDDGNDEANRFKTACEASPGEPVAIMRITIDTERDPTDVCFQLVELSGEMPRLFGGKPAADLIVAGSWAIAVQHATGAAVTAAEWWHAVTGADVPGIAADRKTALRNGFEGAKARRDEALKQAGGAAETWWTKFAGSILGEKFNAFFEDASGGGKYRLLVRQNDGNDRWKEVK